MVVKQMFLAVQWVLWFFMSFSLHFHPVYQGPKQKMSYSYSRICTSGPPQICLSVYSVLSNKLFSGINYLYIRLSRDTNRETDIEIKTENRKRKSDIERKRERARHIRIGGEPS